MPSFTQTYAPMVWEASDGTLYFILRYDVTNFGTAAPLVPTPTDGVLHNRLVMIDQARARYTQSAAGADPVRTYLSLYTVPGTSLGYQCGGQYVDYADKYLQWHDIGHVMMFPTTGNIASVACFGYTANDDMTLYLMGHTIGKAPIRERAKTAGEP